MVTVLAKELLEILGPFYSNNKSTKKEEENKQPVKLWCFSKLGDAVPTLIFIILGTDDPQQIEDKGYKVYLFVLRENASWLPFNRLLLV